MDTLQEFLSSLSDADKELIKTISLNNTAELLKLDHEQFNDFINNSISVGELSREQLQRRDELIIEIKKIRNRLIIEQSAAAKEEDQQLEDCITVSEAIRKNNGRIRVKGMIVSLTAPFKMISKTKWQCTNFKCGNNYEQEHRPPLTSLNAGDSIRCPSCGDEMYNPTSEFINVKTIQIQDSESKGELERLDAFLFEKDTENVSAGELVELTGNIHIQKQNGHSKNKKLFSVLHTESIIYEQREELTLTKQDIEAFHRFVNFPKLIDRLVSMTAPNVIGENDKKLGILRSAVGAVENSRRGRINTLFVRTPGTAKSMLAREATKIVPNSRYITAQNASGKSLTAIIDKENENTILRLGPIPLAKNAICAINEIGSMNFEDQRFLLDIMEEGKFTIDKYGIHQDIDSPTTIIATANPLGAYWKESHRIGNDEIPVIRALLDRFDQVYAFTDSKSEEEIKEYAYRKIEISKRSQHKYSFLIKYLMYARTIIPRFQPEAITMLNSFWQKLKVECIANNRTFDTVYRIAESHARLHLKPVVDGEIATETMESVKVMLLQYGHIIKIVDNPRDIAQREIVNIVMEIKGPITFSETVKIACQRNGQVKHYLGDRNLTVEDNKRFRELRERFVNNKDSRIIITQLRPLTLLWSDNEDRFQQSSACTGNITDLNDLTDRLSDISKEDNNPVESLRTTEKEWSERSERSERSVSNLNSNQPTDLTDRANSPKFEFECYYCNGKFQTNDVTEYVRHGVIKHPKKPLYPSKATLEKHGLKPQGKSWEI
ncbi:MAG TPA: AAA family ATPase [Nitrososphaeraceae archaeon]